MSVLSDLSHFIRRNDLIPAGTVVVVGISGGPDSLSLLHALRRLAPEQDWHLHAAYLHHGIRPEADEEALFVAEIAASWGLGCTIEQADVPAIATQPGISLEEAARQARYAFLGRVAQRLGSEIVAVGHNADDQAETVIMHLLRGSGLAGLKGMLPSTPLHHLRLSALPPEQRFSDTKIRLIRPWLQTTRAEIDRYCQVNALLARIDATNTDTTFYRNRLRHEILPQLTQINPRLVKVLNHAALALQGDYEILTSHRRALWQAHTDTQPGHVRISLATFRTWPRGDQRAMLRQAIKILRPELRNISWEHTERILDLLHDDPQLASGGPYPLTSDISVLLNYEWLDVRGQGLVNDSPQITTPQSLTLPGTVEMNNDWILRATLKHWEAPQPPPWHAIEDDQRIWLPYTLEGPLFVRARRPGDRLQVFGLDGSKPITDLMTEHKVARETRAQWPLLVDASDRILWVVGLRVSEACRLADDASPCWEIQLMRQSHEEKIIASSQRLCD